MRKKSKISITVKEVNFVILLLRQEPKRKTNKQTKKTKQSK